MFSMRGDAHRVFLRLKKTLNKGYSIREMKEFREMEEIKELYESMDSSTLKLIYYRMVKEKNGSGIVPVFVSSVPWLLFMFSKPLVDFLLHDGNLLWIVFGSIYLLILSVSVFLHFREKAWAAFHIEIIQDILKER